MHRKFGCTKGMRRKFGKRNRMNPDMHTTWWNVKTQKQMDMVPRAFREQSEENDQMNTIRTPVNLIPETLREWEPTL